uniref:Uncharacterized protein n=1 Tax=Arundo donax TaxID=35708 RepID=A0A0A8Y7C8_ARUDO
MLFTRIEKLFDFLHFRNLFRDWLIVSLGCSFCRGVVCFAARN